MPPVTPVSFGIRSDTEIWVAVGVSEPQLERWRGARKASVVRREGRGAGSAAALCCEESGLAVKHGVLMRPPGAQSCWDERESGRGSAPQRWRTGHAWRGTRPRSAGPPRRSGVRGPAAGGPMSLADHMRSKRKPSRELRDQGQKHRCRREPDREDPGHRRPQTASASDAPVAARPQPHAQPSRALQPAPH
jgi:hypothetical protein